MELIENPILNSPFHEPGRHFDFDERGVITGDIRDGRRPSQYFTPIPGTKKKVTSQPTLDLGDSKERVEENQLINQVRSRVEIWRAGSYPGVTGTTRRLLEHWNEIDDRVRPLFFCQREAIEVAIYLTEVAPKSDPYFTSTLAQYANGLNDGLYRMALKMATGTGKTVVMSLLIAWQTINKARNPQDARFTDQFLVVSPGITIKDRLRVLDPADPDNYYDSLDLIPPGLREELNRATVSVINYHQLMLREKRSAPAKTKRLLGNESVFTETPGEMANRVLRPFSGSKQIIVLNDEGHHCYRTKPPEVVLDEDARRTAYALDDLKGADRAEAKERDVEARVWHTGLMHIAQKRGVKAVYDLSATPFYLRGSGWQEGTLFQWVVSDFALTDAIECGIVKIPRVPTRDDVDAIDPAFRALWSKVGRDLPTGNANHQHTYPPTLPTDLEAALRSLYGDYADHFDAWQQVQGDNPDSVPPVFIVVAANTNISRVIHEWMSGWEETAPDGTTTVHHGNLPLFDNVSDNDEWVPRPVSVIVDSRAIDSGEQLPKEFREAAHAEIERFRREYETRNSGQSLDDIGEEGLLREVMNTVGRPHSLGAPIRAVTSVSMLTEGWDANTVTHILGVRAFGTQLLCEQVVGRGLRRVSYELNDDGLFDPEYADVYGVPFAFVPVAGQRTTDTGVQTHTYVHTDERRSNSAITFPRLVGYRYETPSDHINAVFGSEHHLTLGDDAIPTQTDIEDITGVPETHNLDMLRNQRMQSIQFHLADKVCRALATDDGHERPWLFPEVLAAVTKWCDECVTLHGNAFEQLLGLSAIQTEAADRILAGITHSSDSPTGIRPIFDRANPTGDTSGVGYWTRKDPDELFATGPKSHISHVVPHSGWEASFAAAVEQMDEVVRYVKNDHLDFNIPYVIDGISKSYVTDFIVVINDREDMGNLLHLAVEVTGEKRRDKAVKVATAKNKWLPAVNAEGSHGRWSFLEITDPAYIATQLREHISAGDSQ
jgi:type III restriction enzyme